MNLSFDASYSRVRAREYARSEKGIPVPGTGRMAAPSGKNSGKTGVIGNSHVVSHRYMDEGEKGPSLRREIKRKERIMVEAEIAQGFSDWLYGDMDDYDPTSAYECF